MLLAIPFPVAAEEFFVAMGGTGTGLGDSPFGQIQAALEAAQPGDTVVVRPGEYRGTLTTVRGGEQGRSIRIVGDGPVDAVIVTAPGRVLTVAHPYITFESIVFDGQYGNSDTIRVTSAGSNLTLRRVEVRRSSRDLIDMAGPADVLIEDALIHHGLYWDNERVDSHGIAAGAVRNLTVRNTEIHTFSGDAIQIDPNRGSPGWSNVTIEGCHFWLAPLSEDTNGFAAGVVPGENAIDTKEAASLPRATMVIRDTVAHGFRNGLIGNMAAFNLKDHIEVTVDGVTVFDSEIAFRARGTVIPDRGGAWVEVRNAVIYDVDVAFRYENDIARLRVWNSTFGLGVVRPFVAASSGPEGLDVRNLLILGAERPREAWHESNLMVGAQAFVDASDHNYRPSLNSPSVDSGERIGGITFDRDRNVRPSGGSDDVGAFELQESP